MLRRFLRDESGQLVSTEMMLLATILVLGSVVGLKSVRDSAVTELADVAQAFSNISQSFSYTATDGHGTSTAGAVFIDITDFCDTNDPNDPLQTSKCVILDATTPIGEQ